MIILTPCQPTRQQSRFDGRGFVDPDSAASHARYGTPGSLREAAWRSTQESTCPHQLLLEALAVRRDVRGTGIGSALLEAVERRAHSAGKSGVILEVVNTNARAASLHRYRPVHMLRRAAFRPAGSRFAELMLKEL